MMSAYGWKSNDAVTEYCMTLLTLVQDDEQQTANLNFSCILHSKASLIGRGLLPAGPWIMAQTWHDLLFAHWPGRGSRLEGAGSARAGVGYLRRPVLDRGDSLPHEWDSSSRTAATAGTLTFFPKLNVRTYVTLDAKPGVYFFSLDAANASAVWGARTFYHLPYFPLEHVGGDTASSG